MNTWTCTWLLYHPNETIVTVDSVTIVTTDKTYQSGMFELLEGAVVVCEADFHGNAKNNGNTTTNLVLSVVTLAGSGVSILCLLLRILLQFLLPSFKKRPGRLQLQLAVALLLTFIILLSGPFVAKIPEACTTAAILLAYGFLAAFIWMNVIAVDTWLVFRPSAAYSRADGDERSLIGYFFIGWGIPIILVVVPITMNYVDVDTTFRPEFGGFRCWYTQRYAMLIYFGLPVAVSIILNICLYTLTAISLHKSFHSSCTSDSAFSQGEGHHFRIYVRLFVLMGITWVFGFISAFTDHVAINMIFVILTSLQGFFLFVSFVCRRTVLSEIASLRKPRRKSSPSSGSKTGSTPLPNIIFGSKCDTEL